MNNTGSNKTGRAAASDRASSQASAAAPASRPAAAAPSKYRIVKDGWGSRSNFQASYLLGMDPEGLEEGNRILDAFIEADLEEAKEAAQKSGK